MIAADVRLARIEDKLRTNWRRYRFCRANGWGWQEKYRNRLIAGFALRRCYR